MATTAKNEKYVYSFGGGKADGNESMKNLLGGKGANLAEMVGTKILNCQFLQVLPSQQKFVLIFMQTKDNILLH